MMEYNKDFEEFLKLLNKNSVRFVVVGGHAVAFHGYPRYTGDIDFFYKAESENAKGLVKVLEEFGFKSLDVRAADFCKEGQVVQLGQPPNRIDLVNRIDGVDFETVWKNKIAGKYGNQPCYYISLEDILTNKTKVNRPKDQADLDVLKKT